MRHFTPARIAVSAVTFLYLVGGAFYLIHQKNQEFILYILLFALLFAFAVFLVVRFSLPVWMLWLLSILGALHLAGGGLIVHSDALYNYVIVPIQNPTGLTFWKYDQLVHPFGAATAALIAYGLFARESRTPVLLMAVSAFLVANGAGALNEVVEFITKLTISNTDVGGYYNTALDLTFNMAGAFLGSLIAVLLIRRNLDRQAVSG